MKGTDFTLAKLGEVAEGTYSLYSFGPSKNVKNGEFLSFAEDDVTRSTVHIHFYTHDLVLNKDDVTITGHAIWAKSLKDGWYRQKITLTAQRHGEHWTAELTKGDTEFIEGEKKRDKFTPPPNEQLKQRLYDEVVDPLADILAYTLNQ